MSVYEYSLQDTIRTVLEITIELQKTSSPRLRIFLRKVSAVDVAAGREDNFATQTPRGMDMKCSGHDDLRGYDDFLFLRPAELGHAFQFRNGYLLGA